MSFTKDERRLDEGCSFSVLTEKEPKEQPKEGFRFPSFGILLKNDQRTQVHLDSPGGGRKTEDGGY